MTKQEKTFVGELGEVHEKLDKIDRIYEEIARKETDYGFDGNSGPFEVVFPVLIGDVLDWFGINYSTLDTEYYGKEDNILDIWKTKRLPLEEQSEEAISYIFNLLNEGKQ